MESAAFRPTSVVLTRYFLYTVIQNILKLCKNKCNYLPFICKTLLFRQQVIGSNEKLMYDNIRVNK